MNDKKLIVFLVILSIIVGGLVVFAVKSSDLSIGKNGVTYFVSYRYPEGFGNIEVTLDRKIKSFDDLNMMRDAISEKRSDLGGILIINYIKLDKKGSLSDGERT